MQNKLKIGILGSRGIPNQYSGFEQCAEYLSVGLVDKGHDVMVYNPHYYKDAGSNYKGVHICHKYCPEDKLGSVSQFIYDYICLRDALKKDFDIILELGYGTVALSYLFLPIHQSTIITNMDGLEWKRSKFNNPIKKLLQWSEKTAAEKSHYLIADNEGIKHFLKEKYNVESAMIPYGARVFDQPDLNIIKEYNVNRKEYFMLIARLEPANNVETILEGYDKSDSEIPFLVVGNYKTEHGEYFRKKFAHNEQIRFLGGIFDQSKINNLRFFSKSYFHGHSVGGTNPSLLEAMACSSLIIANDNSFNRSVLEDSGLFFKDTPDVTKIINNFAEVETKRNSFIEKELKRIQNIYDWDIIVDQYDEFFKKVCSNESKRKKELVF